MRCSEDPLWAWTRLTPLGAVYVQPGASKLTPTGKAAGESIVARVSQTHSGIADGPFFICCDKTIGVKVSDLIRELCVSGVL